MHLQTQNFIDSPCVFVSRCVSMGVRSISKSVDFFGGVINHEDKLARSESVPRTPAQDCSLRPVHSGRDASVGSTTRLTSGSRCEENARKRGPCATRLFLTLKSDMSSHNILASNDLLIVYGQSCDRSEIARRHNDS